MSADAITVLTTDRGRGSKLVTRAADGSVEKTGAVQGGSYTARTTPCSDADALAAILLEIGANPRAVLMLGTFRDAPPEEFAVWPRARIAKRLGVDPAHEAVAGWHDFDDQRVVARLKVNTTLSSWFLLDRDLVDDMPPALAVLDPDGWRAAMAAIIPGLETAAQVMVPSTTGRVLVDGQPMPAAGWHLYAQADDPSHLSRVWPSLLVRAFAAEYGFYRNKRAADDVGCIVARQPWSIYDPSTLSPERLTYDGLPSVKGHGLKVSAPDVRIVRRGGRVPFAAIPDLPSEVRTKAAARGVKIARDKGAKVDHVVSATLTADLELKTEDGIRTVRELWLAAAGHTRCQSPFRDSNTYAAYYNTHGGGEPFVFDSGGAVKYVLPPTEPGPTADEFRDALVAWIEALGGTVREEHRPEALRRLQNVIAAAERHGARPGEVDLLREGLAKLFAPPLGTTKSKFERVLRREQRAAPARPAAGDDNDAILAELNEQFTMLRIGARILVGEPGKFDPALKRRYLGLLAPRDFAIAFNNRKVFETMPNGRSVLRPLGTWWIDHEGRRSHLDGIVCDPSESAGPGFLNLWRGFAVEPAPGDCSTFLEHVDLVATGNGDAARDYLEKWLAWIVQNPGETPEVATVLRGKSGVGKGALFRALLRMFGSHGVYVAHAAQLTGKFNMHMLDALFLFADEAIFAGDKAANSALKSIVTEPFLMVEPKGVNAFQVKNRLAIGMASNEDWVVPAAADERRYFVLDVPDNRQGDAEYFKRLFAAIYDDAALGAFLHHLLNVDLSNFNIRAVPQTAALAGQKLFTLKPEEKWLLAGLDRGHMGAFDPEIAKQFGHQVERIGRILPWSPWYATDDLFVAYEHWCHERHELRYGLNRVAFGKFLSRFYTPRRPRADGRRRPTGYFFGPLDEARDRFEEITGTAGGIAWSEPGDPVDPEVVEENLGIVVDFPGQGWTGADRVDLA